MVNKLLLILIVLGVSFGAIISENDAARLKSDEKTFGIEPQIFENKILEAINNLKNYLKNGDPTNGVEPIDPIFVSYETFDFVLNDTALKGFFQNVTISKFSDFEVQEIQFKFMPLLFKIQVFFQHLFINGWYKLSGNLFNEIPVNGTGKFKSETSNMTLYLYMRMTTLNSSLQIKDITFEYRILKEMISYVNEFKGNQVQVLNEKLVFQILDKIQGKYIPPLLNTIKLILNDFLRGYTFQQILDIILGLFNKNLEALRSPHATNFSQENEVMRRVISLLNFELDKNHQLSYNNMWNKWALGNN